MGELIRTCGLILEDKEGKILLQLRDNKQEIPYPNCWGTFGGMVEKNEPLEQAIKREIKEELNYKLVGEEYFANFKFENYDIHVFRKVDENIKLEELKVKEGQKAMFFSLEEARKIKCAFNCRKIVKEYFKKFHAKKN